MLVAVSDERTTTTTRIGGTPVVYSCPWQHDHRRLHYRAFSYFYLMSSKCLVTLLVEMRAGGKTWLPR
jgi:hypothetical protein